MNLSTESANFAANWLQSHCQIQSELDNSLTWYVRASTLYSAYVNDCYANGHTPLSFEQLWTAIRLLFPSVKPKKLQGQGVYVGLRFYTDKAAGLRF